MKKKSKLSGLKTDYRWKWMAAASVVGAAAAHANTITLNNNFLSSAVGGNQLNADLTGDGIADVTFANILQESHKSDGQVYVAEVKINGTKLFAFDEFLSKSLVGDSKRHATASIPGHKDAHSSPFAGSATATETLDLAITFTDAGINGGLLTSGQLQVTASAKNGFAEISLDSLTYAATPSVPDSGSTLSLLALGVGGIAALRQRRKAAAQQ